MSNETKLLAYMLNCGYADVSYFCELLEDFNIEYEEIGIEEMEHPTVNDLIYNAFSAVCQRHGIDDSRCSIFTNCLDSHLNIDGDEMYTEEDVRGKSIVEETEE